MALALPRAGCPPAGRRRRSVGRRGPGGRGLRVPIRLYMHIPIQNVGVSSSPPCKFLCGVVWMCVLCVSVRADAQPARRGTETVSFFGDLFDPYEKLTRLLEQSHHKRIDRRVPGSVDPETHSRPGRRGPNREWRRGASRTKWRATLPAVAHVAPSRRRMGRGVA